MNIHPLLVHFPIALLSIYAIFECIRFRKLMELREWFYIKAIFLFLGELGALAAAATGDFGEQLFASQAAIIRVHEGFAKTTVVIFGIAALIYLGVCIDRIWGERLRTTKVGSLWNAIAKIAQRLFTGPVLVPFAVVGFVALIITGALGASIVYGTANDLLLQWVNQLFVL